MIIKPVFCLVNSSRLSVNLLTKRPFWGWLNEVTNRVDPDRIKDVGPDRAAAEWLVRCGAGIRWSDSSRIEKDYNTLSGGRGRKIAEVDGTESTIMSTGFPYLDNLTSLEKLVIKRNPYLDDSALGMLSLIKKSLNHLELVSIANVTDAGVKSLIQLENLKRLVLFDLPSVKSKDECLTVLKKGLPKTDIDWPEREVKNV
ncbi:ATP synthase subunit s, mitochondrial [Halotydeus destructor]|nr:ATP synthase subunit s, mitochondrial [Halotydeus destructor]